MPVIATPVGGLSEQIGRRVRAYGAELSAPAIADAMQPFCRMLNSEPGCQRASHKRKRTSAWRDSSQSITARGRPDDGPAGGVANP